MIVVDIFVLKNNSKFLKILLNECFFLRIYLYLIIDLGNNYLFIFIIK